MLPVQNGGHFLPLDRPQELLELIVGFPQLSCCCGRADLVSPSTS
jgi:hypothetical protein